MLPPIRIKAPTKYGLLKKCWEKEAEGFECIRKIEKQHSFHKTFSRNAKGRQQFLESTEYTYYDAVYRKIT